MPPPEQLCWFRKLPQKTDKNEMKSEDLSLTADALAQSDDHTRGRWSSDAGF